MQAIRIAAVDDDTRFLHDMTGQLTECRKLLQCETAIDAYDCPKRFWADFDKTPHHIVFLDIMLPGTSGIDLSREINLRNADTIIVFMSVSPDFAMHGYGVNAIEYILKPVRKDTIRGLLEKCLAKLRDGKQTKFVIFKIGLESRRLNAESIRYLASCNRHVHVHCKDETVVLFGKLKPLAATLPPEFIQIHQSYIVNLNHAASLKSHRLFLDNGETLPISRPFRKKTSEAFFSFIANESGKTGQD